MQTSVAGTSVLTTPRPDSGTFTGAPSRGDGLMRTDPFGPRSACSSGGPPASGRPLPFPLLFLIADRVAQLVAGADPELLVDASEVALDRLLGDEERLRDLAVRAAVGDLTADAPLRRGQRARAGELDPRRTSRAGLQLRPRALRQRGRA